MIYRLGEDMSIRLPRGERAAGHSAKENYWLPRLAPHLPLPIPVPLGVGKPAFGYPWDWTVSRWLAGETATAKGLADPGRTAKELAEFVTALQDALPVESDAPNPHDEVTGVSLAKRDHATRSAIAAVQDTFDAAAMTAVWDAALRAPTWTWTWTRARGWALTTGLNAYTFYSPSNPLVAMNTHRQISQVLTDHAQAT